MGFSVPPMPYSPPSIYRDESGSRISDLIMRQGEIQAQGLRDQGRIRAQMAAQIGQGVGQLGGAIAGILQDRKAKKESSKQAVALQGFIDNWDGDPQTLMKGMVTILGPERGLKVAESVYSIKRAAAGEKAETEKTQWQDFSRRIDGLEAMGKEFVKNNWETIKPGIVADAVHFLPALKPEHLDEFTDNTWEGIVQVNHKWNPRRAPEGKVVKTVGPDGKPVERFVSQGELERGVPTYEEPPKPEQSRVVTTVGPNGRPVQRLASPEELMKGLPVYEKPDAPRSDSEPLVAVMGDDGQPVLMQRSRAVGRRPANTREQGRPVTSGDANRLADLDTSLDDLAELKTTLTGNKSTGAAAKAGAMLPNAVTEFTGLGRGAKSKQATIDRVKQVIGKALEGGVLRKEDEYKYEKILPTIGDVPEVVKSKLDGLERAITKRRQTLTDSLSDAGYDVERAQARAAQPRGAKPPKPTSEDALLRKYGY